METEESRGTCGVDEAEILWILRFAQNGQPYFQGEYL